MADSVGRLLECCIEQLKQAGITDADISARLIFQNRLNKTPVQLQLAYNESLDSELVTIINSDINRRAEHYPLQYILGEIEFYNIRLNVNESALIPRPETEILVEQAIAAATNFRAPRILDIGTGSGNIAIALAKNIPTAKIVAVDISEKALELAKQNAFMNNVSDKIVFRRGSCLVPEFFKTCGKFDIALSNPPYVDEADYGSLQPEVRLYEPKLALVSEMDTLQFYRVISEGLPNILKPGGLFIVEIGQGQRQSVSDIFMADNPAINIRIVNDLNSIPRVIIGKLPD